MIYSKFSHEFWMNYAYKLAKKAFLCREVPIGCLIIKNNVIISTGYNKVISNSNILDHAEIIALNKAMKYVNNFKLYNSILYVTVEPCIMCTIAILKSRIGTIVYGTKNKLLGGLGGKINILYITGINKKVKIIPYINYLKCSNLLISFFKLLRYNKIK